MSITFIEYGLSSVLPGASSMREWSPRSKMPSSLVFVISSQNRVQRAHRMQRSVVVHVVLLQLALARLVADRTVDRVVQQEELEDGLLRRLRLLAGRVDDHALGHTRVARDLELRRLLDLDEAHAAVAGDREARVPAVVRDLDAGLVGRLDHRVAVGDLDLPAVDFKRGHACGAPARRA
jgi:hypothetical protein